MIRRSPSRLSLVLLCGLVGCATAVDDDKDDSDSDTVDSDTVDSDTVDTDETPVVDTDAVDTDDSDQPVGTPPVDLYRGGSRLRVDVWELGGAAAYAGLYDTQLGAACTPTTATDGVLRCVPDAGDVDVLYSDATCSTPLFYIPDDACNPTPYVHFGGGGQTTCGFPASVEVFGLRSITTPAALYDDRPTCRATTAPASGVFEVDPLSDVPADPTAFVALEIRDLPGADGVGIRWLVGADGTWVAWGHATADGPCAPLVVGGTARCVAEERAERDAAGTFGTPNCSGTPLAIARLDPGCTTPRVIVETGATSPTRLFEVGPTWTGGVWGRAPTCRSVPTTDPWVEVGDALDPDTLPSLSRRPVGTGDVRLRRWFDASDVGLGVEADATMELAATGEGCRPLPTATGEVICLPDNALELLGGVVWYADAACSDPVVEIGRGTGDVGWVRGEAACSGDASLAVASVWDLSAPFEGTLYQIGATCVASLPTFPSQTWRHAVQSTPTAVYPVLSRGVR